MPTWVVSEQTLVDGETADDAVERVIEGIDGRALTRRADLAGAEPTLLPAAQVAALRQWALGLVPGEPSEQLQVGRSLVRELIDTVELAGR